MLDQTFLSASLVLQGPHEGGHQEPEASPALQRQKKDRVPLVHRGKRREAGALGVAAGSLPFLTSPHPPPGLHPPSGAPFPLFLAPFSGNSCYEQMGRRGLGRSCSWLGRRYCTDLPVACRGLSWGVDALRPQGTPKKALLALRKGASLSCPREGQAWALCLHPWGRSVRKDSLWQGEFTVRERQGKCSV